MNIHERIARITIPFILFASSLVVPSAVEAASASTSRLASNALPIELDATQRGAGRQAGEPECFRMEIPSAGLLMLDVAVPGTAVAQARLGLLGPAGSLTVIEQSATHLLAASDEPQSLVACVGAQDPRLRIGEYNLVSAFRAIAQIPGPSGFDREEPQPIEIEPDGIRNLAGFDHAEPQPIEIEPDGIRNLAGFDHAEPQPIEIEPDGMRFRQALDALCLAGDPDDHADVFLCASPLVLGREAGGKIDNGWGDDRDFFVFELTSPSTVQVETAGEVDTLGGLYDRSGQRLAMTARDGQDGSVRLVKTLSPGLYFVRVEAEGWTEGGYSLSIDTVPGSW